MQYKIFHETTFNYSSSVTFSHNIAKLKPINNSVQTLLEYSIETSPSQSEIVEFEDYFGNTSYKIFIKESHEKLVVTAHSIIDLDVAKIKENIKSYEAINITLKELKSHLENNFDPDVIFVKQFLFASELIDYPEDKIIAYAKQSFEKYDNIFLAVKDFVNRIFDDFEFVSGFSDISTPISKIFEAKKGVCQDFATLAIAALRALGIPTRYVSGYIRTIPPKGKEKLFGVDASHAWFSVYLGNYGWIDFDPTNNKIANEEYIYLGYGRDYNDIAPLKGIVQGNAISNLCVRVDVSEN
ncbi:MAG: transglutaminase family protein [Campylobacterales bacterium]|nr:transglutaminase family protein [Campylobacterota bacterium]MBD3842300.1 transglutaminase family protein [Campylobacterales bacterium]